MMILLILLLSSILLNISFSVTIKKVDPFVLININDYYVPIYEKFVFGLKFISQGNINMHLYDLIDEFSICNYQGITKMNDSDNCLIYGPLANYLINNLDINLGKITTYSYFVFEGPLLKNSTYIRLITENYEYQPRLSMESPFCLDFYNPYNNLKIKLKNPASFDIYLNIQYFSNSTKGKIPTQIKLINKNNNTEITSAYNKSINILQLMEPNYNYILEFSPPGDRDINIHSMYCLYYSYYDYYYSYVNVETKSIPIIAPGKIRFFSTYDSKKVNITSGRYNITYYFTINNTRIINCTIFHKNIEGGHFSSPNINFTQYYSCSSLKTNDNIHYSISLLIVKRFTYSYIYLDLEPNDLDNDNYIGNFIEFNRTIENEEYLLEFLDNLIVDTAIVLGGSVAFIIMLTGCNFADSKK